MRVLLRSRYDEHLRRDVGDSQPWPCLDVPAGSRDWPWSAARLSDTKLLVLLIIVGTLVKVLPVLGGQIEFPPSGDLFQLTAVLIGIGRIAGFGPAGTDRWKVPFDPDADIGIGGDRIRCRGLSVPVPADMF